MAAYSISNNFLSISVNTFGAELFSLKAKGYELLWQADKEIWPRHAPVLFPIVGKLKNNSYSYNNCEYSLSQHGFARDKEFVLTENTYDSLEFELTANEETLVIYPFHFSLRIRYHLQENNLLIIYTVFNPDNKPLLFSIGAHPGFNCKRLEGENLNDFYLEFENLDQLRTSVLKEGLLSDENYLIKLDKGRLKLNTTLFENDALVFTGQQIEKVSLASDKLPVAITMYCKGWPYFGIWSKKNSDGFVCLEPWFGITDDVKSTGDLGSKNGIQYLEAHQTAEYNYRIEVKA